MNHRLAKKLRIHKLLITITCLCEPCFCRRSIICSMNSFFIPSHVELILHSIMLNEFIFHPWIHILSCNMNLYLALYNITPYEYVSHSVKLFCVLTIRTASNELTFATKIHSDYYWNNIFGIYYHFNHIIFWLLFQCITKTLKIKKNEGSIVQ